MSGPMPPWVGAADLDTETAHRYRSMSPEERWRDFCELQSLADALLATHPARERALWIQEERSAESLATWRRLMRKYRRAAHPR